MQSRTRSIVLCGLSIAFLSVGAAIILPLGPIPFTLQTLMLILISLILTPKEAIVAVGGYLLLGAIGLPIFSGLTGGFGVLLGPTGGFLIGFFVAVLLTSLLRLAFEKKIFSLRRFLVLDVFSILIIILVYYSLGLLWFMYLTGSTFITALTLCVIPFIVPDIIKAIAAFTCAQPIRIALGRAAWREKTGEKASHKASHTLSSR